MDRWYGFVDQYQRDHGFTIDEAALREKIEAKIGGDVNEDLQNIIQKRIYLAVDILEFLEWTKRRDAEAELAPES